MGAGMTRSSCPQPARCPRRGALPARSGGFTYLWVLLTVALMGLGLALTAEMDSTLAQRDREKELLRIGHEFRAAIGHYHELQPNGSKKEYPAAWEDLLKDNRMPGVYRHLRKIYVDPMTGKSDWEPVMLAGRIVGVRSKSDRATIKRDGFLPQDAGFIGKEHVNEWVFTFPADLLLTDAAAAAAASAASAAPSAPIKEFP